MNDLKKCKHGFTAEDVEFLRMCASEKTIFSNFLNDLADRIAALLSADKNGTGE